MNERLTTIEETVAHQQRLLDELNGVVTAQRNEIDALVAGQLRLRQTVARMTQHFDGAEDLPDEKPPHY